MTPSIKYKLLKKRPIKEWKTPRRKDPEAVKEAAIVPYMHMMQSCEIFKDDD